MGYNAAVSIIDQLEGLSKSEIRAAKRQEDINEEDRKLLNEILALTAYIEGASLDDVSSSFEIDVDTLKYKIKKVKENGVKGLMDLRVNNGAHNEKKITKEVGQRIIEIKVLNPEISTREITDKLYEQDKTEVSHTIVNKFLNETGMNEYKGSPYRGGFSPLRRK